MKKHYYILFILLLSGATVLVTCGQGREKQSDIRLIIRGDDIGSFHAANDGCMKSYTDGIMRSVEIMVPCAWYPEAVNMLNEEPGLDVGIHLVMTSEWEQMKWRPLTGYSSITDPGGYFFPMVWPNDRFPPDRAFRESGWTLQDVENELRAQIELAKKDIKSVSHISSHMGFTSADPAIDSLVKALAVEYDLYIEPSDHGVKRMRVEKPEGGADERIEAFITALRNLEAGTWLFVEHPAMDTPEMESIGHKGYAGVGRDRQIVTDVFTSDRVIREIEKLGIELISYADLVE